MGRVDSNAQNADFKFPALEEAKHYRAALIREFSGALCGRVLEIGAGIGQTTPLLLALPSVKDLSAVEPDPRSECAFRQRNPDVSLHAGTAGDLPSDPGWDAALSINVLEHSEHDAAELRAWHRLLASCSGRLCLFVPARQELYAQIDRDFAHYRRYHHRALRQQVTFAGFSVERLVYFNLAGYFLWWLNFKIRRARGFSPGAVRLFDRTVFRLTYAIETIVCRPPIGQSLLAIARASA